MLWWVLGLNPAPFSVFGAVREFRRQSPCPVLRPSLNPIFPRIPVCVSDTWSLAKLSQGRV